VAYMLSPWTRDGTVRVFTLASEVGGRVVTLNEPRINMYLGRLARQVPVRIHLDLVPVNNRLLQGMTATVQDHPRATDNILILI
jgi:multidrug resistance efflux pump